MSSKKSIARRRSNGQGQGSIPTTTNNDTLNNNDTQTSQDAPTTSSSDAISQNRKKTRRPSARDQARSGQYELVEGDVDGFANAILDLWTTTTTPGNKDKTSPPDVTDVVAEVTVATDAPVAEDIAMDDAEDDESVDDDDDEEDSSLWGERMDVDEPVPNVPLKVERGTINKTASSTAVPSRSAQPMSHRSDTASASAQVKAEAMRKAPKVEKKQAPTTIKKPVIGAGKKLAAREDNMSTACEPAVAVANIHGRQHAPPEGIPLYACGKGRKQPPARKEKPPSSSSVAAATSTSGAGVAQQMLPQPNKLPYGEQTKTTDPRPRPAPAAPVSVASKPADAAHVRKTTRAPSPAPAAAPRSSAAPAPAQASTPSAQEVQPARPVLGNVPVVTNLQPADTGIERPKIARPLTAKPVPDANAIPSSSKVKGTTPAPSTSSALAKENAVRAASSPSMTSMDRLKEIKADAARPAPAPLALPSTPPPPPPPMGSIPLPEGSTSVARPSVVPTPAPPTPIRTDATMRPPPLALERLPPPTVGEERESAPAPVTPQVPAKRFNPDAGSEVPSKRQRVSPKMGVNSLPGPSTPIPAATQLIPHSKHWHGDDQLVDIQCGLTKLNGWRDRLSKGSDLFATLLNIPSAIAHKDRPFVDITGHCQDVQGVEYILDELMVEGAVLRPDGSCPQENLRRLLRASHALDFKTIYMRAADALRKSWPNTHFCIAQTPMRFSMVDALETICCVRQCDPQRNEMSDVFLRAAYEVFSACKASFRLRDVMGALGFVVGDGAEIDPQRLDSVAAVRNHCEGRWTAYCHAPNKEYPSVCDHADADGVIKKATQAQRDDKFRRWHEAMTDIHNGFVKSETDWTFDPIRAGWALRARRSIRPHGWQVCKGDQCRRRVYEAWDRRIKDEFDNFQDMVREHIWGEVVG